MVDKVKPLKLETTPDGSSTDMYPRETNPAQDYLALKGLAFENSNSYTMDVSATGEVQYRDNYQAIALNEGPFSSITIDRNTYIPAVRQMNVYQEQEILDTFEETIDGELVIYE